MITQDELAIAELIAAEAAHDLAAVERETAPLNYTEGIGQRIAAAVWRARHTATHATQLRELHTQQQAALTARTTAEEDVTGELPKMAAKLTTSRDKAVKAIQDAEKAMLKAIETVTEHDRLVKATAADMVAAGLPMKDVAGEHDTGGDARDGVRLQGEFWSTLNVGALFARSIGAVAHAAWGPNHLVSKFGKHYPGMHTLTRFGTGQIVDRIAALPQAERPARVVVHHAPVQGAPVLWASEADRTHYLQRQEVEAKRNEAARASMEELASNMETARQERIASGTAPRVGQGAPPMRWQG